MKQTTVILTIILSSVFWMDGLAQTPRFDQLKESFEEGRIFEAEFSHFYRDAFTGEEQQSEGKIWIGKKKYRIEGDTQSMVVDCEISTVYDQSRNRVIVSEYIEEEDDFAPSRMLQGVDESFSVEEEVNDDGGVEITLTSDDPYTVFQNVTIMLNSDGDPVRIVAIDQVDNELITSFEEGFFTTADSEIFELEVPDDAERIDLRQEAE